MRPPMIVIALILMGACRLAAAQPVLSDHYSLGLRFGALIGQQRLASPPLPSLAATKNHKFNIQGAYVGGHIDGLYYLTASDGALVPVRLYAGYARAYSGAFSYTSPSIGRYSLFTFGIYTRGAANFPINFSNVNFQDSKLVSISGGIGANYLLFGEGDSPLKLGAFGGGFVSKADAFFNYVPMGTTTVFPISSEFTDFGPMAGLLAELHVWKFAARSFAMYAYDVTPQCVDLSVNTTPQKCFSRLNSSFGSLGASVGLFGFNVTVYSRVKGKINDFDIQFERYQLGYTLSL